MFLYQLQYFQNLLKGFSNLPAFNYHADRFFAKRYNPYFVTINRPFDRRCVVRSFQPSAVIVMFFVVITIDQARVLFGIFLAYSLSGYVMWAIQRLRGRTQTAAFEEAPAAEKRLDDL